MSKITVGKCLLSDLLKQKHMTSTDLAVITGISINQLSAYINNKRMMSLPTAFLIAWALRCNIQDLYSYQVK